MHGIILWVGHWELNSWISWDISWGFQEDGSGPKDIWSSDIELYWIVWNWKSAVVPFFNVAMELLFHYRNQIGYLWHQVSK